MLDETALAHPVSASQIADYELCPKKWGFNKLDGIKKKANRYAQRGTDAHERLEDYSQGKDIDLGDEIGRMVEPGLKFLPMPGTAHTERSFRFETDTAVYVGKIDLSQYEAMWVYVLDHKTTGDFKWLKHIDKLKEDVQSNLYAVAAIALTLALGGDVRPEEIEVQMAWVYYRANPKRPAARKVQLHVLPEGKELPPRPKHVRSEHFGAMTHQELDARFRHIENVAAEMLDHYRKGHKAEDLPPDLRGCNAFGGCGYRGDPCQLTFGQILGGHVATQTLAEKMKAAKAARTQVSGNTATAAPTQDAGEVSAGLSPAERLKAAALAKKNGAPSTAKPSSVAKSEDEEAAKAAAVLQAAKKPPAVNPPESGARPDGRLRMAGNIASGIVGARIFGHNDPMYADQVGHLAVEITDAIIAASKK